MKKILSFILSSIVALNLSISVANSAAKEVRVAYFLEWPSPNLEDMQKKNFAKALGVPVKWTNFTNGGAMTDAMLAGDIDISYSQGLVPYINAPATTTRLSSFRFSRSIRSQPGKIRFITVPIQADRRTNPPSLG
jgi:ABC-type nitrate/sulfonate/bicarbonate transport system substrate-binding protein